MKNIIFLYLIPILFFLSSVFPQGHKTEILPGANDRIEKYRKGSITLYLTDLGGHPVEQGKTVLVEQQNHEFLFGCNIFKFNKCKTSEQNTEYANRFAELFNFATLPFYWWGETKTPKREDKPWREFVIKWCLENRIILKGHTLAWNWKDPKWLDGNHDTVYAHQMDRIENIINQYGEILYWDVINEATEYDRPFPRENAPRLTEAIQRNGVDQFLTDGFRRAQKANPNGVFIINDFKTGRKFQQAVLEPLVVDGTAFFDAIGLQSHMHNGYWGADRIWKICERFSEFHRPLHFTEISIVSGEKSGQKWVTNPIGEIEQANQVKEMYTLLFSNPNVEAITWWDFSDQGTWKGAPAGLLRKDMSPKPAYTELQKLIKEKWWTKDSLTVDEEGQVQFRGFYGDYQVQVIDDNEILTGHIDLKKGQPGPIHLKLK